MKINIIAIGKTMPRWVADGYNEYAKRLPKDYQLNLIEIGSLKRTKSANISNIIEHESKLILDAIPQGSISIALSEHGKQWHTNTLAKHLQDWHDNSIDISLLIGGPDGLAEECLAKAERIWSLSTLTLPHMLVRVIIAEQIYRAWTIINNHPYHRE